MRKTAVAAAGAMAVISASCWSTPEPVNKASSTPSSNVNTVSAAPGQTVLPMPTVDLPAATSNRKDSNQSIGERANRNAAADVRPDAKPGAPPEPLKFLPAPENSEIAVTMRPDGMIVETRVFKNHPKLSRAELSYGKGERVLKITLRDGRTVSVSGEKVEALRDIKAAQLVIMAPK